MDLIAISSSQNKNISFSAHNEGNITYLPAFALFAHSDTTFWENAATSAEYVGDALSLLVGVGPAWRSFRVVTAIAKATSKAQKIAIITRSAVGVMEVTAGAGNLMLKATGYIDTPFGKSLANVLMWMEFASLGVESSIGVAKNLSKTSKQALKQADTLLKESSISIKFSEGELKQIGHLLMTNLEGSSIITGETFRKIAGATADDIKLAGVQTQKLSKEFLESIKDLSDKTLHLLGLNRNSPDFKFALANNGAYLATLNGKSYFTPKLDELKGFFHAMGEELKKGASGARKTRSGKNVSKVDEAFEVAELERKLGDFVLHSSDEISESFIKNIVKQVRKSTGLNDFDIHLIDRNNEKLRELFSRWQEGGGYGFFKPNSGEFGIPLYKGLSGKGPQIYMFAGKIIDSLGSPAFVNFTKYTTQHELFHVEMFMYLKNKTPNYMKYWKEIPTYMHEQYVLNRLLKTKNWKQADLLSDLKNVNEYRGLFDPKLGDITLKELETWKFELELEKTGIKIK